MLHLLDSDVQKFLDIYNVGCELGERQMCLIWFFILIEHVYLSGMSLGVAPRTGTKKASLRKMKIGLCDQNVITILSPTINITGGGPIYHSMNTRILTLIMN